MYAVQIPSGNGQGVMTADAANAAL